MSSQFPQRLLVSYITTVALPCLVILYNSCMLGLVVFKLWELRRDRGGTESNSSWKKVNKEKGSRLWKDCATVLGLSCVLGLPWWLASTTYISLPGIYVFTIINSLQGQYVHDPLSYTLCSCDLLGEFTTFLLSSQVYSCSCGPWLWPASLDLTVTPQSETLLPLRKWWLPVSITDIHS